MDLGLRKNRRLKIAFLKGGNRCETGVVAQVKGQTEMLDMGVYLFNQLGRRPETKSDVAHLEAIVLIRPTRENIIKLENELRNPAHKSYHICNFY